MPELPDLTVVADALHASLAGREVRSAEAPGPLAVRGTPAELDGLVGQRVEAIRRRGKFLLIALERDEIACNPMLTGRFQLAQPGEKLPTRTAVILGFGPRSSQRWQPRQNDVMNPPALTSVIRVPQRGQGWPPLSWTARKSLT